MERKREKATLLSTPSKYAVKVSDNLFKAKHKSSDLTSAPDFTYNNYKKFHQSLPSDLSKLTLNEIDSDDPFERRLQTNGQTERSTIFKDKTSDLQASIQSISKESESMVAHSLLNEKGENIELTYEPYIARKRKLSLQVEQWYSMYNFLKCTPVLGHTKTTESVDHYQEMFDTILLLVKKEKNIKVDGNTEMNVSDFREFKEKYDKLLDEDHELKRELDSKIKFSEMKKKKHQENIYKKWTKKVYNPLMDKLQEAIQGPQWLYMHQKHDVYKQYLQYVNTKGYAYLDTVDPEEYSINPYPSKVPGKVNMNIPDDPLLYSTQQYDEELQVTLCLLTGKNYTRNHIEELKQLSQPVCASSRQKLDAAKWLLMPENNILSTPRTISRRKIQAGQYNKSILSESMLHKCKNIENQRLFSLRNNKLEEI